MGHGFTQQNMQKVEDEAGDIARTTEVIARYTGRRPRGWLGPGLTETWETPDLLVDAGYEYVCDWVLDDEPVLLNTRSGPILSVPYTQECNDVAMMLIQHHKASEYADRAIDQFEQLRQDAKNPARVMALVIHPYIMGAPHRLKYFRKAIEHIRNSGEPCSGLANKSSIGIGPPAALANDWRVPSQRRGNGPFEAPVVRAEREKAPTGALTSAGDVSERRGQVADVLG